MQHKNWHCQKCTNRDFKTSEIRVSPGFWSSIFDVQHKKYIAVTCENCRYTEFYQGSTSKLGNIMDFLTP